MQHVTITIPTNINGKLANKVFLHIDKAPAAKVLESHANNTRITIRTADDSHPPVDVQLVDLSRQRLFELSSLATLASHGIDAKTFINQKCDEGFMIVSQFAVYCYQKL